MPEGTKVHSCVEQVKAKGGVNPYAVCQASTGQSYATGKPLNGKKKKEKEAQDYAPGDDPASVAASFGRYAARSLGKDVIAPYLNLRDQFAREQHYLGRIGLGEMASRLRKSPTFQNQVAGKWWSGGGPLKQFGRDVMAPYINRRAQATSDLQGLGTSAFKSMIQGARKSPTFQSMLPPPPLAPIPKASNPPPIGNFSAQAGPMTAQKRANTSALGGEVLPTSAPFTGQTTDQTPGPMPATAANMTNTLFSTDTSGSKPSPTLSTAKAKGPGGITYDTTGQGGPGGAAGGQKLARAVLRFQRAKTPIAMAKAAGRVQAVAFLAGVEEEAARQAAYALAQRGLFKRALQPAPQANPTQTQQAALQPAPQPGQQEAMQQSGQTQQMEQELAGMQGGGGGGQPPPPPQINQPSPATGAPAFGGSPLLTGMNPIGQFGIGGMPAPPPEGGGMQVTAAAIGRQVALRRLAS